MIEADPTEAEASLNALLEDEASKLRILDYLRWWQGERSAAGQSRLRRLGPHRDRGFLTVQRTSDL
jgi:hypothetical protein